MQLSKDKFYIVEYFGYKLSRPGRYTRRLIVSITDTHINYVDDLSIIPTIKKVLYNVDDYHILTTGIKNIEEIEENKSCSYFKEFNQINHDLSIYRKFNRIKDIGFCFETGDIMWNASRTIYTDYTNFNFNLIDEL